MALVYQRFTHVAVTRSGQDVLLAIDFMDSHREDNISLLLDSSDFTVKEAMGETPRNPGGVMGFRDLKALVGKKIYLKAAQGIKESLMGMPKEERGHLFQMILAGISNVVQAEVFLLKERGFATPAEFEAYFQKMYEGGCIYYSNLDRVQRDFLAYVEENHKGRGQRSLFSRQSNTTVRSAPGDERYLIRCNICDSFHEMAIKLLVDSDRTVLATRSSMVRVPDPVCREGLDSLDELVGQRLTTDNVKALVATAGGPKGCAHLGDLVADAVRALDKAMTGK
jgi:hypothetical protein